MKTLLAVAAALALVALPAAPVLAKGTPPTAEQKAQFLKLCLKNSGGNSSLCTCKAEQAMTLIDTDFMKVVIATMNGKSLSEDENKAYGVYISQSNRVCAPGM